MQYIETKRIAIRASYDCEEKRVKGDVYTKTEGEEQVLVGTVVEEQPGVGNLTILPEHKNKSYILEDFEELKEKFADYANFWRARSSRGIC